MTFRSRSFAVRLGVVLVGLLSPIVPRSVRRELLAVGSACSLPARRATRVDPVAALRME